MLRRLERSSLCAYEMVHALLVPPPLGNLLISGLSVRVSCKCTAQDRAVYGSVRIREIVILRKVTKLTCSLRGGC